MPLTLIAVSLIALLALASAAVTPLLRRRINEQFLVGARNQAEAELLQGMLLEEGVPSMLRRSAARHACCC